MASTLGGPPQLRAKAVDAPPLRKVPDDMNDPSGWIENLDAAQRYRFADLVEFGCTRQKFLRQVLTEIGKPILPRARREKSRARHIYLNNTVTP